MRNSQDGYIYFHEMKLKLERTHDRRSIDSLIELTRFVSYNSSSYFPYYIAPFRLALVLLNALYAL